MQGAFGDDIQTIGHHRTARQVKSLVDCWDDTYTFSTIRNPWDRMVSTYHFKLKRRDKKVTNRSFEEWIIDVLQNQDTTTQCDYLAEDGKIIVDFVARFENLNSDFKKICQEIGANKTLLHENKTEHERYANYYTDTSKNVVANIFKDEVDMFGYKFGE